MSGATVTQEERRATLRPNGIGSPNFLVVGVQRCGTTWLDSALRGHPQVFLPESKQSYFFDQAYERGIDWYRSRFAAAQPEQRAVGEVATGYSLPHAIPRLAAHCPGIKLIMAVRNPVDRAHSYYQSRSVKFGWKTFDEAVAAQPDILERGRYIEQIELLLEHYERDRLLVTLYDDLVVNDERYLQVILRFLEVDDAWKSPKLGKLVQTAAFPRLRRVLRKSRLEGVIKLVSRTPLGDKLKAHLKKAPQHRYPPMARDLRVRLVDYYGVLNERLGAFLGRDLSRWNA